MLDIFKITRDGFGVHTFEIKICHLTGEEAVMLRERMKNRRCTYDDSRVMRKITQRNSGLRIALDFNGHFPPFLSVIVSPEMLMNKNAEMTRIMSRCCTKQLYTVLDYELKSILGCEFPLSRFRLVRIDCCVNFIAEKNRYTADFINLLRRSMLIHSGKVIEYSGIHADHTFTVEYSTLTFTVYDKYRQLADCCGDRYGFLADSAEGMMRFELQLGNRITGAAYRKLGTNDPIKVVEYFTENSEKIFKDFICHHFLSGDFFIYPEALKMISGKKITSKISERMKNYLVSCDNDLTADENLRTALPRRRKMENMLAAFADLGIYPVYVEKSDLSGNKILPGPYTLFNITEQGAQT